MCRVLDPEALDIPFSKDKVKIVVSDRGGPDPQVLGPRENC
jgi:hypothetical protein